ncbi:hypothetical protein AB0H07_38955 [Streptomyces sp. NPDC021354]|uniref:hypothetical protein n=1 Tax=Streptomyces sp. NPDC021354 TaxID=3154793 RepID=UPI003409B902
MPENKTPPFPPDLLALQLELHQTRAEYLALCRDLPWSAAPLPGWAYEAKTMGPAGTRSVLFEDSPGYTSEQAAAERQLRERLVELSVAVSTHIWWGEVEREDLVAARMALKHAHDQPAVTGEESDAVEVM